MAKAVGTKTTKIRHLVNEYKKDHDCFITNISKPYIYDGWKCIDIKGFQNGFPISDLIRVEEVN